MGDSKLRQLEREWQETGNKEAKLAYKIEQVRVGEAFETCLLSRTNKPRRLLLTHTNGTTHTLNLEEEIANNAQILDFQYANNALNLLIGYSSSLQKSVARIDKKGVAIMPAWSDHVFGVLNIEGKLHEADLGVSQDGFTGLDMASLIPRPYDGHAVRIVAGIPLQITATKTYAISPRRTRNKYLNITFLDNKIQTKRVYNSHYEDGQVWYQPTPTTYTLDTTNTTQSTCTVSGDKVPETSRIHNKIFIAEQSQNLASTYGVCDIPLHTEVPARLEIAHLYGSPFAISMLVLRNETEHSIAFERTYRRIQHEIPKDLAIALIDEYGVKQ